MSGGGNNATYAVQTVVRGYHVYKEVWSATVGQILPCQQERGNVHDPYSVAIVDENTVVGHVPRAISAVCSLFLRRNGVITCEVFGGKHYSNDLPKGGLEIPCKLVFSGKESSIDKVQKLLQEALASGLLISCSSDIAPQQNSSLEPAKKKQRIEEDSNRWVQLDGTVLSQTEKDQLCNGEWLTDRHVNYAHALLKKQFPHIDGLKNTLLIQKKQEKIKRGVQIVHTQGNHMIVASSLRCSESEIEIFDSLYTSVDNDTQSLLLSLFETNGRPSIKMAETCDHISQSSIQYPEASLYSFVDRQVALHLKCLFEAVGRSAQSTIPGTGCKVTL